MHAYKFLTRDGHGPLSGFVWPKPESHDAPGPWVDVDGPLELGRRGVHVCHVEDLVYWLHDALWVVECEGDSIAGPECHAVRRARLVHPIGAWQAGGAARFGSASAEHAAEVIGASAGDQARAMVADAQMIAKEGYVAVAAYTAALAVAKQFSPGPDAEQAFRSERIWQSGWIAREILGL